MTTESSNSYTQWGQTNVNQFQIKLYLNLDLFFNFRKGGQNAFTDQIQYILENVYVTSVDLWSNIIAMDYPSPRILCLYIALFRIKRQ